MGIDGVMPPPGGSGFGRGSLKYRGKIFAMLVRGSLVLKLPADRVTALITAGDGVAFDANKGTAMREWFSLAGGVRARLAGARHRGAGVRPLGGRQTGQGATNSLTRSVPPGRDRVAIRSRRRASQSRSMMVTLA